jgi:dienelactone hydrolase
VNRAPRRRRVAVATVLGVALAAALGGWLVLRGGSGAAHTDDAVNSAPKPAPATAPTSTTAAPTTAPATTVAPTTDASAPTTPPAQSGPPYAVGVTAVTLVDPSRPGPARGDTPATPQRQIAVTVRYPTPGGPGSPDAEGAPAAPGTFPLVVFAHGFDVSAATYAALEDQLASAGFVVAAPDFPLSSSVYAGDPVETDIPNQALDVDFVISSFDAGTGLPAVLAGHLAPTKAGVTGQSDGGTTAALAAGNPCCDDPAIGAAAVLSGDDNQAAGPWFGDGAPLLVVQGDADDVNPPELSQQLYDDDTATAKMYVDIVGGDHLDPYTTGSQREDIGTLLVDFFRAQLEGGSPQAVVNDANVAGVLALQQSSP